MHTHIQIRMHIHVYDYTHAHAHANSIHIMRKMHANTYRRNDKRTSFKFAAAVNTAAFTSAAAPAPRSVRDPQRVHATA